jgi:cold-inducible RNA-binding protein
MEESKKIYVGNLDYGVNEEDLKQALEDNGLTAGEVSIISDKYTGRSKGFGFIEFETEEDAQKAIDALNGKDLNGRALRVNKAQKRKPRSDNFGSGGGNFNRGGRY